MSGTDLFGNAERVVPPGFSYTENFITPDEEVALLSVIKRIPLAPMNFHGYKAKRKVRSFGFDYSFENRSLQPGEPIPIAFQWLIERISPILSVESKEIAELLITEYTVGSVINWHRDAPPFDVIVGISLAADCVFRLKPHDKAKQSRKAILSIPVARRSMYIMKDEARSAWQHSTAPATSIRYSITLRTLRSKRADQRDQPSN